MIDSINIPLDVLVQWYHFFQLFCDTRSKPVRQHHVLKCFRSLNSLEKNSSPQTFHFADTSLLGNIFLFKHHSISVFQNINKLRPEKKNLCSNICIRFAFFLSFWHSNKCFDYWISSTWLTRCVVSKIKSCHKKR